MTDRANVVDNGEQQPARTAVHAIVVHYRSNGMLSNLMRDLASQKQVDLDVRVVECGDDGSVVDALKTVSFAVERPGENLGYCGGNNLILSKLIGSAAPVCLINPDVRIRDPLALHDMAALLASEPRVAAVAPSIRTPEGNIEYTGSTVNLTRACAVHTGTHVREWGSQVPGFVEMSWIDGACWMLRSDALRELGLLDERFFLFSEEVDWCIRAAQKGWRVGVLRDTEVLHDRSSSFGDSTKGAYYAWRNSFLLCKKHEGYGKWVYFWSRSLLRFAGHRGHIRSGMASAALRGGQDALLGKMGRMPGDG